MINIVMLTRNRRRLTTQALESIDKHSPRGSFNLTIVDDGSADDRYLPMSPSESVIKVENSHHNLGSLKNLGVYWSERRFGRGDWLAIFDNDIAIIDPRWMERCSYVFRALQVGVLGGCRHPYHGVNERWGCDFSSTDAVAGYSHFMRWDAWDQFGPYPETGGEGINRSEDYAFCRKAVDAGLLVGYIDPPVLVHTGLTNSEGKPAVGSDQFLRVDGVVYE